VIERAGDGGRRPTRGDHPGARVAAINAAVRGEEIAALDLDRFVDDAVAAPPSRRRR